MTSRLLLFISGIKIDFFKVLIMVDFPVVLVQQVNGKKYCQKFLIRMQVHDITFFCGLDPFLPSAMLHLRVTFCFAYVSPANITKSHGYG